MSQIPREINEIVNSIRDRLKEKKGSAVSQLEEIQNNMGFKNALTEFKIWQEEGKKDSVSSVMPVNPECLQLRGQPDTVRTL